MNKVHKEQSSTWTKFIFELLEVHKWTYKVHLWTFW